MKMNIKWSICRVCLEEDTGESKCIFNVDDDKHEISAKIKECGGINIHKKANLPDLICKTCLSHLNIAYRFRNACKSSDEKLQVFLDKTDILIQDTLPSSSLEQNNQDTLKTTENTVEENDGEDEYYTVYCESSEDNDKELVPDNSVPSEKKDSILKNIISEYIIESDEEIDNAKTEPNDKQSTYEITLDENIPDEETIDENLMIYDENYAEGNKNTDDFNKDDIKEVASDYLITIFPEDVKVKTNKKIARPSIYTCEVCGNKYDRKYSLQQHMRWHSNEKPYACEICGKSFVTEYQINRHMRVHTGEKPYKCQYCNRSFSDASTKMKHERIHTNSRPFKCDVCPKSFNYSDVLKVHKMTHTGEKPYGCDLCGKRFTQMHHLKAHLQTLSHKALSDIKTVY